MIGVIETILSMIIQVIYPMHLIITGSFVFKMYLIYFMFENPDLYLAEELESAKKKQMILTSQKQISCQICHTK